MVRYPDEIEYSDKYDDGIYEYSHVILPKAIVRVMWNIAQGKRLLKDDEWRDLGVQQTRGWEHYDIHRPEPHILLFRRPVDTDPQTGLAPIRIWTLQCTARGDTEVYLRCLNMAGQEVLEEEVDASTKIASLYHTWCNDNRLAPGTLKLVLENGVPLDENSEQPISSCADAMNVA